MQEAGSPAGYQYKITPKLMQVQGKVFDGQYLNGPFIQAMNKPVIDLLSQSKTTDLEENPADEFWWPAQWDPAHWLNLVFEKFKGRNSFHVFSAAQTLFIASLDMGKCTASPKQLPPI